MASRSGGVPCRGHVHFLPGPLHAPSAPQFRGAGDGGDENGVPQNDPVDISHHAA